MIVIFLTWIGIGIALSVLVLLIVPIRIFAMGLVDDRKGVDYQLKIDWAFGIFSVQAIREKPLGLYCAGLRICHIPLNL